MALTEWLDEQPDYGICNPPMSSDQALNILFEYLIPGCYDILPESREQVNTYIVHTILMRYSSRYRREFHKREKTYRKIWR